MFIKLQNLNIHYKTFLSQTHSSVSGPIAAIEQANLKEAKRSSTPLANNLPTILFLHGWGANIQHYEKFLSVLSKTYRTIALDLPGFGLSNPPLTPWQTENYVSLILSFIQQLNLDNLVIIGHSLGGKIGLVLAKENPKLIRRLILISSAGIPSKKTACYYCKVYSYKLCKKISALPILKQLLAPLVYKYSNKVGSTDYKNASGLMRITLVKLVQEDLRKILPSIKIPVLLIWGDKDNDTPLANGESMANLLPNAKLAIITNAGHFPHLDKMDECLKLINSFLREI